MPRHRNPLAAAALLAAVLLLAAPPAGAGLPPELTVATEEGRAGLYRVGQGVAKALVAGKDGLYRDPGQPGIECVVANGRIAEIHVTSSRLFTERGIRVSTSTMTEVLKAYGRPAGSERAGNQIVLSYPGFRARFPWVDDANRRGEAVLSSLELIAGGK